MTTRHFRFATHTAVLGLALLLAAPLAQAADSESRPLAAGIDRVVLTGPIDLDLNQSATPGIEIKGRPELRARVKIDTSQDELRISWQSENRTNFSWNDDVRVKVSLPALKRLAVRGSGDASIARFDLKQEALEITVEGSGDVQVEGLAAGSLQASIKGSGDIRASGRVERQQLAIAGSGDIDTARLESKQSSIAIAGSGDARVWATEALDVSIAGSGDVSYLGNPRLSQNVRGSGEVRAAKP